MQHGNCRLFQRRKKDRKKDDEEKQEEEEEEGKKTEVKEAELVLGFLKSRQLIKLT